MFGVITAEAQNVTRKDDTFIQDTTSHKFKKQSVTLTRYKFKASNGVTYPIYMSKNGKCFIIRTNKEGKQYRDYLPEITKQLQNENSNK